MLHWLQQCLSDLCHTDRADLGWNRQSLKAHSAQPVHTSCRSQLSSVRQICTFTMRQLLLYCKRLNSLCVGQHTTCAFDSPCIAVNDSQDEGVFNLSSCL